MKRKTTKLNLKRAQVSILQSLSVYEDGTIIVEDNVKNDYYVFQTITSAFEFLILNYE